MAGYTLAKEFRKLDSDTPITLITADLGEAYPKPMLSNALSKGKEADALTTADATAMADTLDIQVLTNTWVKSIDTKAQILTTSEGEIAYQQLVLAIGASPIRIPTQGDGAEDILSVNNIDDYRRFRDKLKTAESVAIIGPGLIGSEFASDIRATGKQVDVIGPDPYPVSTLLPEAVGKSVRDRMAANGVNWHLETVVDRVDMNRGQYQITLANGHQLTSDLVLSAVGLRPNTGLAEAAGIKINRGIVADQYLRTSQPNIYALGDCAEVEGLNLPFVMPIMIGARALAKTLSGDETKVSYPAMPVVIKTVNCPLVTAPPPIGSTGEWKINNSEAGVIGLFKDEKQQLLGFALVGDAVKEKMALTKTLPPVLP
jgi:rubredoxin-NAD+ reductase